MKKLIRPAALFMLAFALVLVFPQHAQAAQYTDCADALNTLGLFGGTGKGYELDAVPTRMQALTMLIRLTGQEKQALECTSAHPFTDVPSWADRYAAFAWQQGLTKGISETAFGASNPCDSRMYATFVLRALGYSDTQGDFSYESALPLALEIGIADETVLEAPFLRDNMAAVSYLSLNATPKNSQYTTLLDSLVGAGAVSAEAAAFYQTLFSNYSEYSAAMTRLMAQKAVHSVETRTNTSTYKGNTATGITVRDSRYTYDGGVFEGAILTTSNQPNQPEQKSAFYYHDSHIYYNLPEHKLVSADPYDQALAMSFFVSESVTIEPLYILSDIGKAATEGRTVYSLALSPEWTQRQLNSSLEKTRFTSAALNQCDYLITVEKDGSISSIVYDWKATFYANADPVSSHYLVEVTFESGSGAAPAFPDDLDTYIPASVIN